jgi:hypothetical protein
MKPRSWDNDVLIEKNKQTSLNTKYEYWLFIKNYLSNYLRRKNI